MIAAIADPGTIRRVFSLNELRGGYCCKADGQARTAAVVRSKARPISYFSAPQFLLRTVILGSRARHHMS